MATSGPADVISSDELRDRNGFRHTSNISNEGYGESYRRLKDQGELEPQERVRERTGVAHKDVHRGREVK